MLTTHLSDLFRCFTPEEGNGGGGSGSITSNATTSNGNGNGGGGSSSSSSTTSSSSTSSSSTSSSSSTTSSTSSTTSSSSTSTSIAILTTTSTVQTTVTPSRSPIIVQTTVQSTISSSVPTNTGGLNNGSNGSSSSSGFFDNKGAVGGTFAAVAIVAIALITLLIWALMRRRRKNQMDADIVAATTAGPATTRTPFDDDDPEMIEDPNYGTTAIGSPAFNGGSLSQGHYYNEGYEPSHFSNASPGYAGMGAYGPGPGVGIGAAAAGATAAGAVGNAFGAYYAGQTGYGSQQDHYYDPNNPQAAAGGGAYSHEGSYYPTSPQMHSADTTYAPHDAQYVSAAAWPTAAYHPGTTHSPPPQQMLPEGEGMPFATHNSSRALSSGGGPVDTYGEAQLLAPGVFNDAHQSQQQHSPQPDAAGVLQHPHGTGSSSHTTVGMSGPNASTGSLKEGQDDGRKLQITNQ
ncbi:hypothetical protein K437DRAFT_117147 [Tilletiaria anomala UBC 951]|uniref:REJ domain-containing protein n=1 Tax=Tilletiaria anomala (strain ATCC 24038 / CBS 436.72 / UBC 951) TaxID=1037660 RepID=A0A066WGL1_TILAU|nr:uncharacterized protein K437DRAFT_117147 [Tilletiaria anomala UBC 951]KDN53137.1 hypothetical protein K437DRAFT_117147 [Tilletiaria anomala UBC 951]